GGQTWTEYPIPFAGYKVTGDPAVSFDADGTAYLATRGVNTPPALRSPFDGTGGDTIVSHSPDGGRTWSAPGRVATGKGAGGAKVLETDNDKEYVTGWGHGNAIVTWTQRNWGPQGQFINQPIFA